jgi:hypothetical protein
MTRVLQTHISNVVTHYKGQCYCWDVVNEAVEDNGSYRNFPLYRVLGKDFIPIAFKQAALSDPAAKLYYKYVRVLRTLNCSSSEVTDSVNVVTITLRIQEPRRTRRWTLSKTSRPLVVGWMVLACRRISSWARRRARAPSSRC